MPPRLDGKPAYADDNGARAAAHLFEARAVTKAALIQLLKGRVKAPRLFLVWRALTVGRFRKSLESNFPGPLLDVAALPIWIYLGLRERIEQAQAFEIMRIAMLSGGLAQWNAQYETVDVPRTFENFCDEEIEANRSGLTRWNTLEVVERTPTRMALKVTRCRFHELCVAAGAPELTPVVCQIDNAAFNSYLPDRLIFDRGGPGRRISDGASTCAFIWELRH